jgi:hypothetical protein
VILTIVANTSCIRDTITDDHITLNQTTIDVTPHNRALTLHDCVVAIGVVTRLIGDDFYFTVAAVEMIILDYGVAVKVGVVAGA